MTNTKFRRRALISSVAMLLVAMLALGSATFAWFTADPKAKTKGLDLKAQSSTGLLIKSETENSQNTNWWSHEARLNAGTFASGAFPAGASKAIGAASMCADTTTNKGKFFKVEADKDNAYNASTKANGVTPATAGTDYYAEKLYLKVTGNEAKNVDLYCVDLTNTSTDLAKGLRVAITKSDNTVLGVWKPSGSADNHYLLKAGTYGATGVLSNDTYEADTEGVLAEDISIGSIGTSGSDYLNVYVYLDGEDTNVYSRNISQEDMGALVSSLVIKFVIHGEAKEA